MPNLRIPEQDFHGSPRVRDSLFHLQTPYMSLGRSPCDFLILKDDKSSVTVADFNNPSMCVYAVILNRLRPVASGHTRFCQFAAILGYGLLVIGQNIGIKLNR